MTNKVYMVETVTWNNTEEDFENEEVTRDLDGIPAMKMIADFLSKYPDAHEANIETDPEDGMFISLCYTMENGDEYWLSAYARDRED